MLKTPFMLMMLRRKSGRRRLLREQRSDMSRSHWTERSEGSGRGHAAESVRLERFLLCRSICLVLWRKSLNPYKTGLSNFISFLFRAGGGTSPMIPGNRSIDGHGANSCSQNRWLRNKKLLTPLTSSYLKRFFIF